MTDQQIIQGILNKNKPVFDYLYQKYGPKVLGYVIKNSGNVEDGKEVLNQTLVKIWENVRDGKYESHGKFQGYFMTVAIFTWHEALRRRKKRSIFQFLKENHQDIEDTRTQDLEEKEAQEEQFNRLQKVLKILDAPSRELIQLYYTQKVPIKEIAKQKGIAPKTMAKRLFDCRKKIKKLLVKELELL